MTPTPDQIEISDLHLRAIIGVNPDERENRQDVLVNITLDVDTRPAAASDQARIWLGKTAWSAV